MDFWNDKDERYRFKMVDVYNEQVKDLIKIIPDFKIANATIHFDEVSPHMHIVGVPVSYDCKRGMKKQVVKSKLFTKTTLTQIQDKMRNACIKSFNKFYDMDFKLKEKQKGRNQDINVNEMGNYREMKKKLEKQKSKLENANKQTKKLDNISKDISKILDTIWNDWQFLMNYTTQKWDNPRKIVYNKNYHNALPKDKKSWDFSQTYWEEKAHEIEGYFKMWKEYWYYIEHFTMWDKVYWWLRAVLSNKTKTDTTNSFWM